MIDEISENTAVNEDSSNIQEVVELKTTDDAENSQLKIELTAIEIGKIWVTHYPTINDNTGLVSDTPDWSEQYEVKTAAVT